jgi:hypothetical protein
MKDKQGIKKKRKKKKKHNLTQIDLKGANQHVFNFYLRIPKDEVLRKFSI